MELVCEREKCTGCGLCRDICPKKAITMAEDAKLGHYVPQIDDKACIDCGLCVKHCPSLKAPERKKEIATYAAWRIDAKKRCGSSSGGVAAEFYEAALEKGYHVVGICLDEQFSAKMKVTSSFAEAQDFRGSKYIQADTDGTYAECLRILKDGGKVLFIGTPCQCAAARSMAGEKYQQQLLNVELICHGTPSQKVFHEYVSMIEKQKKKKVSNLSFRSSWGFELTLDSDEKTVWKYKWMEDDFLFAFQMGLQHAEACYQCPYANKARCADLTIGDFWKIGTEVPFERPDCKVSVVIVNSEKGREFLEECKGLKLVKREYQEALNGNPNLYRASKSHPQRARFLETYREEGLKAAYKATIHATVLKKRWKNKIVGNAKAAVKKVIG